jgi:hypothetical protein
MSIQPSMPREHSCVYFKSTCGLAVGMTHAEYKKHMYLQHGMGDGDQTEKCRGWNRCGGLNV